MVTKDEQDAIPAFIVFQGCATLLGMITANGITKEVFLEAAVMDRMQLLRMSARIAEMMRHLPKEMTGGYDLDRLDSFPSMIQAESLYTSDPARLEGYWKVITQEIHEVMHALDSNPALGSLTAEYDRLKARSKEDWPQPSRKVADHDKEGEVARAIAAYMEGRDTPFPASGIWCVLAGADEITLVIDHDDDMLQSDANGLQEAVDSLGNVVLAQHKAIHPLSWDTTVAQETCVWLRGDERLVLPIEIYHPAPQRNGHGEGCDCGHCH